MLYTDNKDEFELKKDCHQNLQFVLSTEIKKHRCEVSFTYALVFTARSNSSLSSKSSGVIDAIKKCIF